MSLINNKQTGVTMNINTLNKEIFEKSANDEFSKYLLNEGIVSDLSNATKEAKRYLDAFKLIINDNTISKGVAVDINSRVQKLYLNVWKKNYYDKLIKILDELTQKFKNDINIVKIIGDIKYELRNVMEFFYSISKNIAHTSHNGLKILKGVVYFAVVKFINDKVVEFFDYVKGLIKDKITDAIKWKEILNKVKDFIINKLKLENIKKTFTKYSKMVKAFFQQKVYDHISKFSSFLKALGFIKDYFLEAFVNSVEKTKYYVNLLKKSRNQSDKDVDEFFKSKEKSQKMTTDYLNKHIEDI